MDTPGFNIPTQFLNQLEEYSRGYMLIVCNERGEVCAYESFDNPVIRLGLVSFADAHVTAMQRNLHNAALREEERMSSEDENPDDEL